MRYFFKSNVKGLETEYVMIGFILFILINVNLNRLLKLLQQNQPLIENNAICFG